MTSASVLFYGRSSRSRSSRISDDDLIPPPHSSSSSSDPTTTTTTTNHHHHRHRKYDPHRRHHHHHNHRHHQHHTPHLSSRSPPLPATEPQQRGCIEESPSQDIICREATHGLSRRTGSSSRLPGSVLLAKERLLQRLRGVSISGVSTSGGTSANVHDSNLWLVDADWETSVTSSQTSGNTVLTESPLGEPQRSPAQEPNKKPVGLTKDTLSLLRHEVFYEPEDDIGNSLSKSSNDCSICLENFLEGNELISLDCGHRFHTKCLYPWLRTCGECPYCRTCIMMTT